MEGLLALSCDLHVQPDPVSFFCIQGSCGTCNGRITQRAELHEHKNQLTQKSDVQGVRSLTGRQGDARQEGPPLGMGGMVQRRVSAATPTSETAADANSQMAALAVWVQCLGLSEVNSCVHRCSTAPQCRTSIDDQTQSFSVRGGFMSCNGQSCPQKTKTPLLQSKKKKTCVLA